jgi:hypothetical protein
MLAFFDSLLQRELRSTQDDSDGRLFNFSISSISVEIDDSDNLSFMIDSSDDDDLSLRTSESEDEEQITLEEMNNQTVDLTYVFIQIILCREKTIFF